jgi:predicted nucleic-acid-binding protein
VLAVDTNVLVRVLVDDPGAQKQCNAARQLASDSAAIYISQIVQVETVWVLESAYRFSREAVTGALTELARNEAFVLQRREVFVEALNQMSLGTVDFSDCMILAEARAENAELATFDKKLGKLTGTKLVS